MLGAGVDAVANPFANPCHAAIAQKRTGDQKARRLVSRNDSAERPAAQADVTAGSERYTNLVFRSRRSVYRSGSGGKRRYAAPRRIDFRDKPTDLLTS